MRPTYLGFKNPKEVIQAPLYPLTVTNNGTKLIGKDTESFRRFSPKITATKFYDLSLHQKSKIAKMDSQKNFQSKKMIIPKTEKLRSVFCEKQSRFRNTKSGSYNSVGPAKIIDLTFVSPRSCKSSATHSRSNSITGVLEHFNTSISQSQIKLLRSKPKKTRTASISLSQTCFFNNNVENSAKKRSKPSDIKTSTLDLFADGSKFKNNLDDSDSTEKIKEEALKVLKMIENQNEKNSKERWKDNAIYGIDYFRKKATLSKSRDKSLSEKSDKFKGLPFSILNTQDNQAKTIDKIGYTDDTKNDKQYKKELKTLQNTLSLEAQNENNANYNKPTKKKKNLQQRNSIGGLFIDLQKSRIDTREPKSISRCDLTKSEYKKKDFSPE